VSKRLSILLDRSWTRPWSDLMRGLLCLRCAEPQGCGGVAVRRQEVGFRDQEIRGVRISVRFWSRLWSNCFSNVLDRNAGTRSRGSNSLWWTGATLVRTLRSGLICSPVASIR
jgi:hypothetical protein